MRTRNNPRSIVLWVSVGALLALCGVLGALQYRWIGEVSIAARERLRGSLQASLERLSLDLNSEITAACRALLPGGGAPDAEGLEPELASRYRHWSVSGRRPHLFRRIGLAELRDGAVVLRMLDPEKATFQDSGWPDEWQAFRERLQFRLSPEGRRGPGRPGPRSEPPPNADATGLVFEIPLFRRPGPEFGPMPGRERLARAPLPGVEPRPFILRDASWLVLELNLEYVRDVILPEVIQRHLGAGSADYEVEVLTRTTPETVIYRSDPDAGMRIASNADASVGLLDLRYDQLFHRGGPRDVRDRFIRPGPGRAGPGPGRWQMFVRHRAGSLEAVVARTRWRNLAVTGGVLLLMLASVFTLIRSTRRAQRLAELQMEFVAGVSHELRTPLAVIHTAAYNLREKVASNPGQVERYGALIHRESGRLKDMVEEVLQFARAEAGQAIQERQSVSVAGVIEDAVASMKPVIQAAGCAVEKKVDPELPPIEGDPVALRHAVENLLSNAAKYGSQGGHWIGIRASRIKQRGQDVIEIRVADRGPGIPAEEQSQVFEPFFRGRRAIREQVHGSGLGLTLVRKIIEAHGGSIRVQSAEDKGTEFILRVPAFLVQHSS